MTPTSTLHLSLSLVLLAFSSFCSANPLPYADPAPVAAPWPTPTQAYPNNGDYGGGNGIDVAAGASGSSGAFHLGEGGIIAIAVVVSIVVVLGIASTVLFYLAKKRQWEVRKSISRASRRITGKITGKPVLSRAEEERRERRHGAVRLAQGQSRAARDLEKAKRQARATETRRPEVGEKQAAIKEGSQPVKAPSKVGVVLPPGQGQGRFS